MTDTIFREKTMNDYAANNNKLFLPSPSGTWDSQSPIEWLAKIGQSLGSEAQNEFVLQSNSPRKVRFPTGLSIVVQPTLWDFSYVFQIDTRSPSNGLETLISVAAKVERDIPQMELRTIQDRTQHIINCLTKQHQQGSQDLFFALDNLYAEIIPSLQEYAPKPKLTEYMMDWLRANWTNPYPDDECLKNIATECRVPTSVVSNWLINARTRKWRPAIMKAMDLGRPAECLLSDSIDIFDGKDVSRYRYTGESIEM